MAAMDTIRFGRAEEETKHLATIRENGATAPASKSCIPSLASESLGFGQRHDDTVDIPLDTTNVMSLPIQGLPLKTDSKKKVKS
ncbi:hypothetical protein JHK85_032186 [Glycine max]|nr:hypothetical protein JHK85_032186 [Glycine max]KAG4994792.1 hypothetical protein JHK86_031619 [Glycine max]